MKPLLAALGCCFAACGGGIAANIDYDPVASPRMAGYRTWDWLAHPGGRDVRGDTTVAGEVLPAVEQALGALGYQRDQSAPEFRVGYHASSHNVLDVTTVNAYYGFAYGRWYPGGGVAYSSGFRTEYAPGTLILDVADARGNELVWRGIARKVFDGKQRPDEQTRKVNEAVRRLLAQFPPSR